MPEDRLLVVREPWSWFWLPAGDNPIAVDPNVEGSTRSYDDVAEIDWAGVVAMASRAVQEAGRSVVPGELPASAAVTLSSDLPDAEWGIVESWVGHGREFGVTLRLEVDTSTFVIEDGRHRLWGAAMVTQRPRRRWARALGMQTAAGPVRLPARDSLAGWARSFLLEPEGGDVRAWRGDVDQQLRWWQSAKPLIRSLNEDHIATLGWLSEWAARST